MICAQTKKTKVERGKMRSKRQPTQLIFDARISDAARRKQNHNHDYDEIYGLF